MAPRKKVEEVAHEPAVFVLLDEYGKSVRLLGGYRTKRGELKDWKKVHLASGDPLAERPMFREGTPRIVVPQDETELIEFLENHPECEGSPNRKGSPTFRRVYVERDRATRVQRDLRLAEAKVLVGKMSDEELLTLGYLLQRPYNTPLQIKESALKEIEEDVEKFLDMFDAATGSLKQHYGIQALVRKAYNPNYGVIQVKADGFYFNGENLGASAEKVVKYLLDKDNVSVLNAIKEEVRTKNIA